MSNRPFALSIALLLAACGGAAPPAQTGGEQVAPASAAEPTYATFAEQASAGAQLYAAHCAECHGASGEGAKAPKLVGLKEGALPLAPPPGAKYRTTQFKTVADVAGFVASNMPPGKAGSLTNEQDFAVLAFDLKANGIDLGDKRLDAALAGTLDIPRQ